MGTRTTLFCLVVAIAQFGRPVGAANWPTRISVAAEGSTRMGTRTTLFCLVVAIAQFGRPVGAQVFMRPTDRPIVSAAGESWFQLREPVFFAGDYYYRAGAAVFFNGNVMVRTGHYNGIPLYADTTIEPYSLVFVPIGNGLLQPYERPRRGDLAGTVGSRLSSFPTQLRPDAGAVAVTAVAPTAPPVSLGAINVYTPELTTMATAAPRPAAAAADAPTSAPVPFSRALATIAAPRTNDGFWIEYAGTRWVSSGKGVLRSSDLQPVGELGGFPVLQTRSEAGRDVIYLPTRPGVVAPYRRKL
jgi:hypothetical protein